MATKSHVLLLAPVALIALLGACGPNQRERELQTTNQTLTAQIRTLEASGNELRATLAEALAEAERLRSETMEAAEREMELQAKIVSLEAELADSGEAVATLQSDLAESLVALEATRLELSEAQAAQEALVQGLAISTISLESADESEEVAADEPIIRRLAAERDEAMNRATGLADELSQAVLRVEELSRERDLAIAQVAAITNERDRLEEELSARGAEVAELLAERQSLITERQDLIEERQSLVAERQGLLDERQELLTEQQQLLARQASMDAELDQSAEQLGTVQGRAAELTQRLEGLLAEHSGLQDMTQRQRDEIESVRSALEDAQNEVARLTGARGIYTVQDGDSLSWVAVFFYRDGTRWSDILGANAHLIDHPDLIFPGMVLIVPN